GRRPPRSEPSRASPTRPCRPQSSRAASSPTAGAPTAGGWPPPATWSRVSGTARLPSRGPGRPWPWAGRSPGPRADCGRRPARRSWPRPSLPSTWAAPSASGALSVRFLAREVPRARDVAHHVGMSIRELATAPGLFRSLLAGVGLYGLGNFSATLLILRATQILSFEGRSAASAAATAVLLYTAHNAANAFAAYPAGALADRIGRRVVLVMGVALFSLACVAFAFSPSCLPILAALFVAIGASTALVETAEGSHAAEVLPIALRGRGYGVVGLVDGVGDLVSSLVVGVLWTVASPAWGFAYAALLSMLGALVLIPGCLTARRPSA